MEAHVSIATEIRIRACNSKSVYLVVAGAMGGPCLLDCLGISVDLDLRASGEGRSSDTDALVDVAGELELSLAVGRGTSAVVLAAALQTG